MGDLQSERLFDRGFDCDFHFAFVRLLDLLLSSPFHPFSGFLFCPCHAGRQVDFSKVECRIDLAKKESSSECVNVVREVVVVVVGRKV